MSLSSVSLASAIPAWWRVVAEWVAQTRGTVGFPVSLFFLDSQAFPG